MVECDKLKLFKKIYYYFLQVRARYADSLPFSKEELEKGELVYVVFTIASVPEDNSWKNLMSVLRLKTGIQSAVHAGLGRRASM